MIMWLRLKDVGEPLHKLRDWSKQFEYHRYRVTENCKLAEAIMNNFQSLYLSGCQWSERQKGI